MALALADRIKETTTVTGTGPATLLGASTGYQPFSVIGNANTTYYGIADQIGANWEVGLGTYTSSGNTLTRTTVLASSNAGSLVTFTTGTKDIFVTYPAGKGVWYDASGNVGIGTSSPYSQLDVYSTIASPTTGEASGVGTIRITNGAGALTSAGGLEFKIAGDSNGYGVKIQALNSSGSQLVFANRGASATWIERMRIDSSGNVGIGTSTIASRLSIKGTTTTDAPTLGTEFITGGTWTSTGWTGDNTTGWVNGASNANALSYSVSATVSTRYQIAYTVTGYSAGSFTVAFGGQSLAGITATGTFGPTATTTGNLVITPTATFVGTIVVSIKAITAVSTALITALNSTGDVGFEVRTSSASTNTFLGVNSGRYNTTGIYNSAIGVNALLNNTTGINNSAVGVNALLNNTTGINNSAVGGSALFSNTTGYYNSAVGVSALNSNTTGYNNSAVGVSALNSNTTGYNNSAVGQTALYSNTTGYNNSAVGVSALNSNTTGTNNSAFGYGAGSGITSGANNVVIGGYTGAAGPISATGSNYIVLSDGAGNVRQVIDSSGNVGIGVVSPAADTAVTIFNAGTALSGTGLLVRSGYPGYSGTVANILSLRDKDNTTDTFNIKTDGSLSLNHFSAVGTYTNSLTVNASGNVGIGTASPAYKLQVVGSFAATTKSFIIDHPTKEGMKLRYGSLEGPENGIYIRGRLKDSNVIELPEYWTKLIDEDSITVNLTPIGKHQKLYVADIVDNTVIIGGENINCFYTVFAERIDVEKLIVEIE